MTGRIQLGLIVLVGRPPVLIVLNLLTGPLERRSTAEQEQAAHATAVASDLIGGLRVLKGTALRTPTVLSVRWGLDQLRPSLARVATS